MTYYRGLDGALLVNGTAVAQLKGWQLQASVTPMDSAVCEDDWDSRVGGLASWTGSASALIDLTSSGEQAALVACLTGSAPTIDGETALVFESNNDPTAVCGGNALVHDVAVTSQMGAVVAIRFGFTGNGPLSGPGVEVVSVPPGNDEEYYELM